MAFRIDCFAPADDGRATSLMAHFPSLSGLSLVDVLIVDGDFSADEKQILCDNLARPLRAAPRITEEGTKGDLSLYGDFGIAVEVGFLPGVTDNVANTAKQIFEDALKRSMEDVSVHSAKLYLLSGADDATLTSFVAQRHNPLIERALIERRAQLAENGLPVIVPRVRTTGTAEVTDVDLDIDDDALFAIGEKGIEDADGTRRGPLGLRPAYMKAIQAYFKQEGRKPTDVEIETLAQTWSEHCKHTIFASPIDEIEEGLYKGCIKKSTQEIRTKRGKDDICVSVFSDNAGGILFDEDYYVVDKVETHNTPSALDPFGGALTGIVGVNRDCLGFGMGAKPIINRYGFCLATPDTTQDLYRDSAGTDKALETDFIMKGVVRGIEEGGNQSGIPTPQGFVYYDDRYRGKPLVFAGTIGLIPKEVNGKPSYEKTANPGDLIVMMGGRVGKDGIHGATFSSEALNEGSPVTAVQIGDPITQKKLSDTLIREARDKNLYRAITDNGAGGLSSSVGEMGEMSGGFVLDLDKVPLKYPGLAPWEIWVSESQERMTLAVPPEKFEELQSLMASRGVECSAIGEFADNGRAMLRYNGKTVMDLSMDFLHDGLPETRLETQEFTADHAEPALPEDGAIADSFKAVMSHPNITTREFLDTLYDHEVQATSVLKPVCGKGRIHVDAAVTRPVYGKPSGVVTSHGLFPRYSDVDTYAMAAASIDYAVRAALCVGAPLSHMALLDNFCWCDSTDPKRLYQLKQAALACRDVALAYETPFVSGKDSMFNDFRGFLKDGTPITVSVPPTLLVSAIGVMGDVTKAVSADAKIAGDKLFLLGTTKDETGGSAFFETMDACGMKVPGLNLDETKPMYQAYHDALEEELIASAIPLGSGGLAAAMAKKLIGGQKGAAIDLSVMQAETGLSLHSLLFSETTGRILVSVAPENMESFFEHFQEMDVTPIGTVADGDSLTLSTNQKEAAALSVAELTTLYKGGCHV